jgi:hypothetical protein
MKSQKDGLERDIQSVSKSKYNWVVKRSFLDPWCRKYHVEEGQHRMECDVVENSVSLAFFARP